MKLVCIYCWIILALTAQADKPKQALLVGGGLKICSSMSQQHCLDKPKWSKNVFSAISYQTNSMRLAQLNSQWLVNFKTAMPDALQTLLKRFNRRHMETVMSRKELTQKLKSINVKNSVTGSDIIDDLTDEQWYFLLDHYQVARVDATGKSIPEQVSLSNSNLKSQKIVAQFVNMSRQVARSKGKQNTTILVSTASANDVFDAVSFYTQLFEDNDVVVHWLPIEAALQALWAAKQPCDRLAEYRAKISRSFDRTRVYPNLAHFQQQMCQKPEHFVTLVKQADGLFFNGGDQTLTVQALATISENGTQFSPLYQVIKEQYAAGDLTVAGSSAGAAVMGGGTHKNQGIPMINNGASIYGFINGSKPRVLPPNVCGGELGCDTDELSYLPSGGFDLINLGIFDTHFSERNRQYRLTRLLHDTQSQLGIGIDENTALQLMDDGLSINMWAYGEGAVWFFKRKNSTASEQLLRFQLAVLDNGAVATVKNTLQPTSWQFLLKPHGLQHDWLDYMRKLQSHADEKLTTESIVFKINATTHEFDLKLQATSKDNWPYLIELPVFD